jgi:putative Holliday junction resolvase
VVPFPYYGGCFGIGQETSDQVLEKAWFLRGSKALQTTQSTSREFSGRLMALDVGERRVGVAISDPTGTLARPHTVIQRRSKAEDFATVARLVAEQDIERVVVGLPLSLDGEMGPQARRVTRYAQALAETLDVPIEFHDERYSTITADAMLIESGRKRRVPIDAAAAAVILQDYLERRRTESGTMSEDVDQS